MAQLLDRPALTTRIAEEALTHATYEHHLVKRGTAALGCVLGTAGARCLGVLYEGNASGGQCAVAEEVDGQVAVVAGAAITIGAELACDASGHAIPAVAGSHDWIIGEAEEAASTSGEIIVMKWGPRKLSADGTGVIADESTLHLTAGTMSAKTGGITPTQMSAAATYKETVRASQAGDITASVTATAVGIARGAGTISRGGFRLGNTGADSTNPLSLELDVLINGTSIYTTKPALAKTASDGASTLSAGTGVTVGVIDETKNILAAGDVITYTLTLTRTASPSDEMADALVVIDEAYKVGV